MDVQAYLERINYQGPVETTPENLRALQVAHLRTVPFENLSIHCGQPIVLNDDDLYEKIVLRGRGGFCYELNGLFARLLRELGFKVRMLSANVAGDQGFSADFDHMTLLVSLAEDWLVDVGFGDSFEEPLAIDRATEQVQGMMGYDVVRGDGYHVMRRRPIGGEWKNQYRFTLQPYEYADFEPRCHYQQTSPESHFRKGKVCTIATPDGRITISEMRLITTEGGIRSERNIEDDAEYVALLREHFGITEQLN